MKPLSPTRSFAMSRKTSSTPKHAGRSRKRTPRSAFRDWEGGLLLERLEDRLAPSADPLLFQAVGAASLTLRQAAGEIQIVNTEAPSEVLASKALKDLAGVRIEGNGY